MDKFNLLQEQYEFLLKNLIEFGDYSNRPQIAIIKLILGKLNHLEGDSLELLQEIRELNDSLYPPRGGLGEFYILESKYDERIKLNEPIDKAKDITWSILNN